METISLKALANKVLYGNKHGNITEIPENTHGNIMEISTGNMTGNMRCAVLLWSEVLQAHPWVTDSSDDIKIIRDRGITGSIYLADEIRKLKDMDKEGLKAVHIAKEIFPLASIDEIEPRSKIKRGVGVFDRNAADRRAEETQEDCRA